MRKLPLCLGMALVVACSSATEPGSGTLIVSIHQPPAGVEPAVTVTGAHGFQQRLSASTTLAGLPLGTYAIAPANVIADGVRFAGTPVSQTITIGPNARESALEI